MLQSLGPLPPLQAVAPLGAHGPRVPDPTARGLASRVRALHCPPDLCVCLLQACAPLIRGPRPPQSSVHAAPGCRRGRQKQRTTYGRGTDKMQRPETWLKKISFTSNCVVNFFFQTKQNTGIL